MYLGPGPVKERKKAEVLVTAAVVAINMLAAENCKGTNTDMCALCALEYSAVSLIVAPFPDTHSLTLTFLYALGCGYSFPA
jgi:hypothetical protein